MLGVPVPAYCMGCKHSQEFGTVIDDALCEPRILQPEINEVRNVLYAMCHAGGPLHGTKFKIRIGYKVEGKPHFGCKELDYVLIGGKREFREDE